MNRVIVTGVNDNPHYMDHMRVLLMSLKVNAPKERVNVTLINCPDNYREELQCINENIEIRRFDLPHCGAIGRIIKKHMSVLECMLRNDRVMWLDNDIIVRKPLDELWRGVGENTLKIWKKKHKADKYKMQAGVYVAGNGGSLQRWLGSVIQKEGKYLDEPDVYLDGYGSPYWMVSQELLYHCLNEDIKYVKLPVIYNDQKFREESVIWHCKSSHFKESAFQEEYKKYLCLSKT